MDAAVLADISNRPLKQIKLGDAALKSLSRGSASQQHHAVPACQPGGAIVLVHRTVACQSKRTEIWAKALKQQGFLFTVDESARVTHVVVDAARAENPSLHSQLRAKLSANKVPNAHIVSEKWLEACILQAKCQPPDAYVVTPRSQGAAMGAILF